MIGEEHNGQDSRQCDYHRSRGKERPAFPKLSGLLFTICVALAPVGNLSRLPGIRGSARVLPEDPPYRGFEPRGFFIVAVTEHVGTVERRKRATAADFKGWNIAIIKPDRYKPRVIWATQSQLIDRQQEFLVLVGRFTSNAPAGEAGDENKRIISNRPPDLYTPVLTWRQVRSVSPYPNPRVPAK